MEQLGIKLPKAEMDFLEWFSKEYATPKATIYRDKTLEAFKKWKRGFLLDLYIKGSISFKKFCALGNISFLEGMNIIEKSNTEPIIPASVDEYTSKVTENNIQEKDLSIFKKHKPIIRSSPNISFEEEDENNTH